ncbi:MAG: DUF2497 domain-containing protein [Wolbachia sp.]
MNDEQNNQSVKNILEDIKKAISGKNIGDDKVEEKEDDDVLYLEEEFLEDPEEDSGERDNEKKDTNNDDQSEEIVFNNTKLNSHGYDLEKEKDVLLQHNIHISNNTSDSQVQSNDHLVLKENMKEIKELLGKMQSELQHKQQKKTNLTVEELVTSLLKPQLSQWLNKYLYTLVKEVVEKELKDIINSK